MVGHSVTAFTHVCTSNLSLSLSLSLSLLQKGTKAPQAAGKIHTDFEKGFIMAEVSTNTFSCLASYYVMLFICVGYEV